MKKIISVLLALMLIGMSLVSFVSCGNDAGTTADTDTIYIGVYEPASGSNGAGGKQETLGIKYGNAVKNTVTVGGKEYKVELVIVDNESSDDKAVSAATELINKNVSVVLGSYGSSVSIAAADTFASAHLPAIGVTCTNPTVTSGSDYYFRTCFLDPFQGTVLANYAKALGAEKAYVLAELGNAYDVGLANYFKKAFGDETTYQYENFAANTSDFTAFIQNAMEYGAKVIFAPTSVQYAQLIIDAAKAKGFDGTILAGDTWDSNVIVSAAQGSTLDIQVTTFYQEGASADFDNGFVAWMEADAQILEENGGNTMVAAVSAMGYDTYMTALYAIEHAECEEGKIPSRDQIKDSLVAMNSEETAFTGGATGAIYFDEIGDAVRNAAFIKKVDTANNAWVFVKEQKAD